MSTEWLFTAIVVTALVIITIVVIFGGILVVKDDDYDFAEYLADLANLWSILIAALLGTLGRALLPLVTKLSADKS